MVEMTPTDPWPFVFCAYAISAFIFLFTVGFLRRERKQLTQALTLLEEASDVRSTQKSS